MSWRDNLQTRWQAMPGRERRLSLAAAVLVLLALLWWLAIAPALAILKTAETQHRALDVQLQQMQRLQVQAEALRAVPTLDAPAARKALEATIKQLGEGASLVTQNDRLSVTLKGVDPQALAQWLAAARQNAHAVPTEAHLKRNPLGAWDGSVVFTLGAS